MNGAVGVRAITGPPGSRLARLLDGGLRPVAPFGGSTLPLIVADLGAGVGRPAGEGLPAGAALPEAIAIRLRAGGSELRWEDPVVVADTASLLDFCRERGRSSVAIWRADPTLLVGLQLGAWVDAPWRTRLMRGLPTAGHLLARAAERSPRLLAAAADLAFWRGVREAATESEWGRLTSSYAVLVYHRFAGELKPGQERIDISSRRYRRHLLALKLAGHRALALEQLLAFHRGEVDELPRRGYAITVDDAMADAVGPLRRSARLAPQLFVPTAELGGSAHWIEGEAVAGWDDVEALAAAGVAIGSHTRHHRRLTELAPAERESELAGSLEDLRTRLPGAVAVLAYPNGDHDDAVCEACRVAGYQAAYTTEKGRNGAGTNPFRLRRVSVHGTDGALAVLWKAATGEALPARWQRFRERRAHLDD
jgi:peptidoglycan/xylan/chitin deacetylase (PgdA/CDA1 family)